MDKDLLRLVIIAVGSIVVLILIVWNIYRNRRPRREIDFYDKGNPLDNIDSSLIVNTENDEFDIVPIGPASKTTAADQLSPDENEVSQEQTAVIDKMPNIIQFSIVAIADQGFQGNDLVQEFEQAGLEYGSMKIFECLDKQRRVDFAVASMVEPGTFPETDLESFSSPGLVFFIQPSELDQPLQIFDHFIQTIKVLADSLGGVIWDHNREPLSDETIQQFRNHLS